MRIFSFIRKNDNNITVNVQRLCGSALSIGEIHSKKKKYIEARQEHSYIMSNMDTTLFLVNICHIFFTEFSGPVGHL